MADQDAAKPTVRERPSARGRALILMSFVSIFATACALPAFHLDNEPYVWRGVHLLVLGVMGVKIGIYGWLANLPALLALRGVMQGWGMATPLCSVAALLMGLHTLAVFGRDIQVGAHSYNVVHVVALGPAFYVWLIALLQPLLAFLLLRQGRARRSPEDFTG